MSILIDKNTRFVVQGLSGHQATFDTKGALAYGSNVVAGVVPGRKGEKVLDIPMYNTVEEAVQQQGAEASVIYVPARGGKDAILEAAAAGIQLVVVVTEKIPYRDFAEAYDIAKSKVMRIIGPNSNGLISPGKSKLGILGNDPRYFTPGNVGVLSRSGGMNHEICNLLTKAGIGQSTAISIGGDPMVGFSFKDGLKLYQEDEETAAVAFYCEPGAGWKRMRPTLSLRVGLKNRWWHLLQVNSWKTCPKAHLSGMPVRSLKVGWENHRPK